MWSNKKLLFVLLLGTGLLWGLIAYRIFGNFFRRDQNLNSIIPVKIAEKARVRTDTFTLLANYRDPFLSGFASTVSVSTNKKLPSNSEKSRQEIKSPVNWPGIVYGGMIKNQNTNYQTALITINGQWEIVSRGMICKEIKILGIFPDSIELGYGNEIKTFRK
jgi:hypothetical protein